MASDEQVFILRKGVQVWNQWRLAWVHAWIDIDLKWVELPHADLRAASLYAADLSWADLRAASVCGTDLRGADLIGTNLAGADLSEANLRWADLREVYLTEANLTGATLTETKLREANLTGANLTGANLTGANLTGANLTGANLTRADFSGTDLSKADLTRADLTRTDFSGAYLAGADLSATNLTRTDFSAAYLDRMNFAGANLGRTIFGDIDLSTVKGLDTVIHRAPSIIGIDTIYRSQGNVPEVFLRGAGVPENFITYMRSLTGEAIQYYSCFISYSSKDQEFVERLHTDLQSKGVRCWFAPHDMQIGAPILTEIDTAIRLHDKLLLILSENSVGSRWVEHEVLSATAKEFQQDRQGRVLFPVRLDDSVMETDASWVNSVRTRHIGNFTRWKHHASYQKAFDRLLRDLKAGE